MVATREIYWNISGHLWLYFFFLCSMIVLIYGFWCRYRKWLKGLNDDRSGNFIERATSTLGEVLLHKRIFRFSIPGLFHFSIFTGFIVLAIGTTMVFLEADLGIPILRGKFYIYFQSLALDIAGLVLLLGVCISLYHRFYMKPERYRSMSSGIGVLIGLVLIMVTGFLVEGLRISATADPWAKWSPVGYAVSIPFSRMAIESQEWFHRIAWWFHMSLVFALIGYLPFSKLRHVFLGPLNIYLRRLEPKGITVSPIDIENADKLGTETIWDFSWKHLLDLDACTECGRCQEFCPLSISQQAFSPRDVIVGLRESMDSGIATSKKSENAGGAEPNILDAIGTETIWLCRTCRACMEECPVFIEHIPKFIEPRRFEVMENAVFPKTLQDPIESLETRRHAYRGTPVSRIDWAKSMDIQVIDEDMEVDLLYWVGCTTALNEDNWGIAKALSKLLQRAGISFAILGNDEICCGEPARRIGNEYLFETIVQENIALLKKYRFNAIVTSCPHCFNMLHNEYQAFQCSYAVCHHSEKLCELIQNGKLKIEGCIDQSLTYHDPCYLGRYNDIYKSPRKVLREATARYPVEMVRSKSRSFCCGGGGGGVWLGEEDLPVDRRLNIRRAYQAQETGADILATACPFCMTMMRDSVQTVSEGDKMKVLDIAEVLNEACENKE